MTKRYIGKLVRSVDVTIRMHDPMTGVVLSETVMPLRAGEFLFRSASKRNEWIASVNAEHANAAVAA